ncbi:MAG: adenosylmethionine--8-amino-7-oxononanoate transaminase [Candidatus Omnitrophica bacterium]|nr:adenosylmethionine--8-amino-7-oxononanoate transaminase [Candidatus Omnitrophota bacterium]
MNTWLKKDLKYIWHPYTQMAHCRKFPPILIEKAKGIKLFDAEGRWYYDTISSWWCNVHGHNHPAIKKAIKNQLDCLEHVLFSGFTHRPAIQLSEKLISLAPGRLTKVFFSDNGSTSVEIALKLSFQYWRNIGNTAKTRFISLDRGYHGDTVGTMSVSGVDLFNKLFQPLLFSGYKVPTPYCYRCPMGKERASCVVDCIKPLEKLLTEKSKKICGMILEPMVLGAGGMIVYPKEYLARAASLCKKFNVHLILDEVATGFGRTGKMFACEHAGNLTPDFLCLSKGITAGYLPFGATLTTDEVYRAFCDEHDSQKTFYHGHTYTANPLACAAALASLEVFEKNRVLDKVNQVIPFFHNRLQGFRELPLVGDVRQLGLIGALELVENKKTKKALDSGKRLGYKIYEQGLKKRLVLRPMGNIIYFFLPLCVKKSELHDILKRSYRVIEAQGIKI